MLFKALKKLIFEQEPTVEEVKQNGFTDTLQVIQMAQGTIDTVTKYTSNNGRCVDDWNLTTLVMFMNDLTKIYDLKETDGK